MDTIDYANRSDMVAAMLDARKRGVTVEVVGNGRTLRFPDGIGATSEDEEPDTLLGVVEPEVEDGEPTPEVEDGEPTPEVEDGEDGEPTPEVEDAGEPTPEVEDAGEPEVEEDLIGDAPAKRTPKRNRNKS